MTTLHAADTAEFGVEGVSACVVFFGGNGIQMSIFFYSIFYVVKS